MITTAISMTCIQMTSRTCNNKQKRKTPINILDVTQIQIMFSLYMTNLVKRVCICIDKALMDFISLSATGTVSENRKGKEVQQLHTGGKIETKSDSALNLEDDGCRVGHSFVGCREWAFNPSVRRIVRLHHEIKHFYDAMSATEEERSARQDVVDRISSVVHGLWSGAKVEVFGSFKTGLYLPTSDLDLVIFGRWSSKPLHVLSDALVKHGVCTKDTTKVIDKASVPIVKLTDSLSGIQVDISFNMTNGGSTADMIQQYIKQFPALPYLVMVLKQFLLQRDLNDVYSGGLGSYSLVLLVVSFLQLHWRSELQANVEVNYGVLLLEFFELYGINFNYGWTGISVKHKGRYVEKKDGETTLYLEDPQTPDSDVARGSFNIPQIQIAMSHAYRALSSSVLDYRVDSSNRRASSSRRMLCDDSVLSRIIRMPHQSDKEQATCKKRDHAHPPGDEFVPRKKSKNKGGNSLKNWTNSEERRRSMKRSDKRRMIQSMIDVTVLR